MSTTGSLVYAFQLTEASGGFNPLINALQVRMVPEPTACGMTRHARPIRREASAGEKHS